jgi:hypothetical protein
VYFEGASGDFRGEFNPSGERLDGSGGKDMKVKGEKRGGWKIRKRKNKNEVWVG